MASEKFCLKWNDFQSCTSQAFNSFRQKKDFFDVTLVSEDQVQFESQLPNPVSSWCSISFIAIDT